MVQVEIETPRAGWTTEVKITRIIDADTIEVEVRRRFSVRLAHPASKGLIFDTPEKNTEIGKRAIAYLKDRLNSFTGKVTLFIPFGNNDVLMDFSSFSRVIGEIWLDKTRLTSILIEAGHGRLVKRIERTTKPWGESDERNNVGDIGS